MQWPPHRLAYNVILMASVNRPYLKWLMILGIIEGLSTLALFFVAMPLKYHGGQPMAVTIAGGIHGILFLALVGMFLVGRSYSAAFDTHGLVGHHRGHRALRPLYRGCDAVPVV